MHGVAMAASEEEHSIL